MRKTGNKLRLLRRQHANKLRASLSDAFLAPLMRTKVKVEARCEKNTASNKHSSHSVCRWAEVQTLNSSWNFFVVAGAEKAAGNKNTRQTRCASCCRIRSVTRDLWPRSWSERFNVLRCLGLFLLLLFSLIFIIIILIILLYFDSLFSHFRIRLSVWMLSLASGLLSE